MLVFSNISLAHHLERQTGREALITVRGQERKRRMGKVFVGKQQQQEGELAGVCKGPGSSWVMLKIGDGERGPGCVPASVPGDAQSVAPSAEPGPELCFVVGEEQEFLSLAGNAFWGDLGVTLMPGWGHGRLGEERSAPPLHPAAPRSKCPPKRLFAGMEILLLCQKAGANVPGWIFYYY